MSSVKYTLNQICEELSDGLHKAPVFNPNGEYLFVNATNLENGFIVDKGEGKRADRSEFLKYRIDLHKNTILYSIDGTIGNIAKYHGEKCILGKGACYLKIKKSFDCDYVYYLLQSDYFVGYIKRMATGSTIHHISLDTMKNFSFYFPDYAYQKSVSTILSMLDQKIDLNNRIMKKLEVLAKTIYDYWFVQFEFPNAEGKPYRQSGGEMVYNETLKREIPKGWHDGQLQDIANITMGQSPEGESYNEANVGLSFFQGRTDFGVRFPSVRMYTSLPTRFAKCNDILLSVRAPVGDVNIALETCCIGRGLAALNSKKNANSYLFYLLLKLKPIFDILNNNGTTFGALTKDVLNELAVLMPNEEVILQYETIVSKLDDTIKNSAIENIELTRLRDWLLPMLMNGQATVE